MSPSLARKRQQEEPPVPPVSPSLPPCRLSQHPNTESPPNSLHLSPSESPIPDKNARRSGRRFASLQRLCDCCVSPKRRRGPRRARHNLRFTAVATGPGPAGACDENGQISHFHRRSASNSNARTRRRKCSGPSGKAASVLDAASSEPVAVEHRNATNICCGSRCQTFLPTSTAGRDELGGGYFFPCLAKARTKEVSPASGCVAASVQSGTTASTARGVNELLRVPVRGSEVLSALQSQLVHRQLQQLQQQQHGGNIGLFCNPSAGQRTSGIFYKAALGVSAVTVAAGTAVACKCVRHKATQTAAVLPAWPPITILSEHMAVASAAEASAAGKAILPAALAAEATICDGKPTPACSGGEKTAAAVAAEASRAAFLREELLNLAESRYTAVFVPVDQHLLEQMNDEFIRSDISRYPVKNTPSGIVFYSPRYSDDRFIYRHVLLSAGVKRAAEEIANATKSAFLTEGQFIYQLGIHLSPGWEHFMIFKGEMRELILRRPQQQQDSPHSQNHAHIDEISDESDDSEAEESATPATATESRSPPPRHQDLGSLLHEIADTAAIHQIRQQNLVQQRMAIAKAVEKANRLLLLIVQLQRPPQHVPPKVFDRMRCLLASYFFSSLSHFCSGEEQQQRSTGRKFFLQNGSIGKQGQLLLLLLQSVAAARQHYPASDAMELLFLQHKLLLQHQGLMQQKVSRISLRRMDKRQQICAASCAIEAPQELHEKRLEQREDKQQNRQCQESEKLHQQNGTEETCRADDVHLDMSDCQSTSALRLRKRRGPYSTSPLPVATPHMDSSPMQQHGKRQPACCNATAVADDSAGCPDDASAALESAVTPRRMAAKERATSLPAVAAGGIGSPTSQGKEKRRRCPLKQEKLCR